MTGSEAERAVEVTARALLFVARERADQVEADPFEMALPGVERRESLRRRMRAAEEGELLVVEALQPEAQAIDSGRGEVCEAPGLDAVGIGLERDLEVVRSAPVAGGRRDQRLDRRR